MSSKKKWNIFQKVPKNALFDLFFQKRLTAQKNLVKMGSLYWFSGLWELRKSIWSTWKNSTEFLNFFFWKSPLPPLEKILDQLMLIKHMTNYTIDWQMSQYSCEWNEFSMFCLRYFWNSYALHDGFKIYYI